LLIDVHLDQGIGLVGKEDRHHRYAMPSPFVGLGLLPIFLGHPLVRTTDPDIE
jgi:hypothetical protein